MSECYMLNKPRGLLTAKSDPRVKTVMECFPEEMRERLHPIGRLDKDTEGMLIFTDDGKIDNQLMQPEKHVEKKYFFYAIGQPDKDKLADLERGVRLYGADKPPSLPAKISFTYGSTIWNSRNLLPEFRRSKYLKNPEGVVVGGYAVITEGKKHQVKLMLQYSGCKIFYLKRVAIGSLSLDRDLKAGDFRKLTDEEVESMFI